MKCSKCGETEYYYTKGFAKGHIITVFNSDGEYEDTGFNSDMYQSLEHNEYKSCYCYSCDKKLTKKEVEE